MRWIVPVEGEKGTPFPQIAAEPDPITVVRYIRRSDKLAWASFTVAFPAIFYVWGTSSPVRALTPPKKDIVQRDIPSTLQELHWHKFPCTLEWVSFMPMPLH
jgi:hypothetical protein